jgi:hypothetical protein
MVGFSDDNYVGISFPHSDALVVALMIASYSVHQILVDNGSLVDIMYWSCKDQEK